MGIHEQALLPLDRADKPLQWPCMSRLCWHSMALDRDDKPLHEQALLALDRDDKPLQYGRA